MEIIISIVVCENNIHKIKSIQNTWLTHIKQHNLKYYFIIDEKYKEQFNEQYKEQVNEQLIYINNLDNDTHFNIIRYFDSTNYDFIFINYLDSFLNVKNLLTYLKTLDATEQLYIGGHGDYRNINNTKFYFHSFTPGIVLTKPATKLLLDNNLMTNYNKYCYNNDLGNFSGVAIGYYAYLLNIKLVINNNFHYCNWHGSPCHNNTIIPNNIICCFNMDNNEMNNYFNFLNNQNNKIKKNIIEQTDKNKIIICPGGGLGNIMFQYFMGYSLGKEYNYQVYYQINYNYWRGDINKYKMFQHLNFIDLNTLTNSNYTDYNEPNFYYTPIKLENNNYKMSGNNNYKISGYYQSYKYSEKYITQIRDELFYNVASLYFKMEKLYYSMKNDKPSCLIHVRRGDYLNYHNVHPTCSDEYYKKALTLIPNCKYFIFSDDIPYIQNWSIIKNVDYVIVDNNDPEEILILMSFCEHFIIANSTLSLVAYMLRSNQKAKLVAPKIWFGPAGYKYKIEDIIPPTAIII
jgi:hypothetical protein